MMSKLGRVLPFVPPLVLLVLIATHAVNVPRWDEWGLVQFVVKLRDGSLGFADFWMQHNEHRIASVKLLLAPIALATDFDVRAMMYAGFGLQLLAFAFLWRVLAHTFPEHERGLVSALALAIALLMFSPAQHENWLWGITSLQWHLCNLAPAAAVWLFSRRPRPWLALAACFVLTWMALLAVASGIVLWGVAFVVIVTEAIAARRWPRWPLLAAWAAGAAALAVYFAGLRPTEVAPSKTYFLAHPREWFAFVRIYLGWPIVQGTTSLRMAGWAGTAGLLGFAAAGYAALRRGFLSERMLPWLWLSSYALLVAMVTAVGRVQSGLLTATGNRYSTGALFFWIGLLVVAAVALRQRLEDAPGLRRVMVPAAAVVAVAAALNYARLYREGCWSFVQTRHDRLNALAELWTYRTAPVEALTYLCPPYVDRVREDARSLEARGLGPFAPHMSALRRRLADRTATAAHVVEGEGYLEVALCQLVSGWAWDRRQPDVPVKVDIYADGVRVGVVPAYWYRRDLAEAGIGNGRHGYIFIPPAGLRDGRPHLVRARISGTDVELMRAPMPYVCSDLEALLWR